MSLVRIIFLFLGLEKVALVFFLIYDKIIRYPRFLDFLW